MGYSFSIFDLIPWLILLLILLSVCLLGQKVSRKASIIFWAIFIFSGIRYGIGYDYPGYKAGAMGLWSDYTIEGTEPIARYLLVISSFTHYQLFFIVTSFLVLYPVYKIGLKSSRYNYYPLLLFLFFPNFFIESISTIRNSVAYSMVFAAYYFLNLKTKKSIIISILCIVIALGFHNSALIGLFIYPIHYLRISKKFNVLIYIFSFFAGEFLIGQLAYFLGGTMQVERLEAYAAAGRSGGQLMSIPINIIAILNFIFWEKFQKSNYYANTKYLTLVNFGVCLWNLFINIDSTIALRLSSYFMLFLVLLYSNSTFKVINVRINKIMLSFFVLLFISSFVINIANFKDDVGRMSILPYQVFYDHTDYSNYTY